MTPLNPTDPSSNVANDSYETITLSFTCFHFLERAILVKFLDAVHINY